MCGNSSGVKVLARYTVCTCVCNLWFVRGGYVGSTWYRGKYREEGVGISSVLRVGIGEGEVMGVRVGVSRTVCSVNGGVCRWG